MSLSGHLNNRSVLCYSYWPNSKLKTCQLRKYIKLQLKLNKKNSFSEATPLPSQKLLYPTSANWRYFFFICESLVTSSVCHCTVSIRWYRNQRPSMTLKGHSVTSSNIQPGNANHINTSNIIMTSKEQHTLLKTWDQPLVCHTHTVVCSSVSRHNQHMKLYNQQPAG